MTDRHVLNAQSPATTMMQRASGKWMSAGAIALMFATCLSSTALAAPKPDAVGPPAPANRSVAAPEGLTAKFQSRLDKIREEAGFPGATAAFVLRDGRVGAAATGLADRENREPMTPASRMLSGSVGKTFVAAVALELVAEGKLDLDEPVSRWLGRHEWFDRLPNAPHLTLRNLLTHSSGLPDHIVEADYAETLSKEWVANPDGTLAPQRLAGLILDHQPLFPAGQGYHYSDTGYILVGMVIEESAQRPYYTELQQRFLKPLALDLTSPANRRELPGLAPGYLDPNNAFGLPVKTASGGVMAFNPGTEWTGGGLCTNSQDLVRWAQDLYRGAALPASVRGELLRSAVATGVGQQRYGLGVFIDQTRLGSSLGHGGWFPGYRSSMRYFPALDIAVAIQINTDIHVNADDHVLELAKLIADETRSPVLRQRAGRCRLPRPLFRRRCF